MRDPDLLHKSYELEVPQGIITIDALPEYDISDYDMYDDKDFGRFITDVERDVRNSFEYKRMVAYLREYVDMNQCAFFKNINSDDNSRIRIEIHHEPLSLYDIVVIVINKRTEYRESLEVEDVSAEVMYLHYNMMVGLIPLCQTVHELVHNQYLFIPSTAVYGKYKEFINRYQKWMLPEQIDTINRIEAFTKEYEDSDYKDILGKHYVYVNMDGSYTFPTMESVLGLVKDRINDIFKS